MIYRANTLLSVSSSTSTFFLLFFPFSLCFFISAALLFSNLFFIYIHPNLHPALSLAPSEIVQILWLKGFPLDAFISDYGWFTNVPNAPTQDDFGYNPSTFPEPATQLESYHNTLNVRFGGIRKPRITNAAMLASIKAKGWVLSGSDSNLNFSIPAVKNWYVTPNASCIAEQFVQLEDPNPKILTQLQCAFACSASTWCLPQLGVCLNSVFDLELLVANDLCHLH